MARTLNAVIGELPLKQQKEIDAKAARLIETK